MNVFFAQALKQIIVPTYENVLAVFIAQCQKDLPALGEVFEMRNGKENRDHYNFLTFFVSFLIVLQIFPVNLFQL